MTKTEQYVGTINGVSFLEKHAYLLLDLKDGGVRLFELPGREWGQEMDKEYDEERHRRYDWNENTDIIITVRAHTQMIVSWRFVEPTKRRNYECKECGRTIKDVVPGGYWDGLCPACSDGSLTDNTLVEVTQAAYLTDEQTKELRDRLYFLAFLWNDAETIATSLRDTGRAVVKDYDFKIPLLIFRYLHEVGVKGVDTVYGENREASELVIQRGKGETCETQVGAA